MHYCDCKGTTKLQLLQRVFLRMLTIETSAYSYTDILKCRILKKIFGVNIAFVPSPESNIPYIDYIGKEFDLIYIDDKSVSNSI